ncbi:MAG: HAD hydrolase-like protein [Ignisphaera sp.]|uniref:HAD family hydrolase n=1 Tax=Ignisphaera aggregans TaxID=334771 RepID=A0A7J3I5W2_9CREN
MDGAIEAVIFDVDGTLVILPIDWDRIASEVRRVSNGSVKTFLGFIARYHETEKFWYIHRLLEEEELRAVENMKILDNAPSYIASLCNVKKVGFVTMQSRKAAEEILRRVGLTKCADVLVAREDAPTRAVQLSIALNRLNVEPSAALFIGDKIGDAIAAIVNNTNAIIIMRGSVNMKVSDTDYLDEDLEVFGIHVVENFNEAIELARKLFNI